jgi:tyrosinase
MESDLGELRAGDARAGCAADHRFDQLEVSRGDPRLRQGQNVLAPDEAIPRSVLDNTFGNQCRHGNWFFLPWHRGYLYAFEAIVAATVKKLTGDEWALPYWNYLDDANPDALRLPAAFTADTMPDGTPNPLKRYPRRPNIERLTRNTDLNLSAMAEDDFVVGRSGIGFGGGIADPLVAGTGGAGQLEVTPHNVVHGMVDGFLGNVLTAGLDPLFWLHHCNIDRLWEAWMRTPGKRMVRDPHWNAGPQDRKMVMPTPRGDSTSFTCLDTLQGGKFYRDYDNLEAGTGVRPGAAAVAAVNMGPSEGQSVEPIGANASRITVGPAPERVEMKMDAQGAADSFASMGATTLGETVVRLYLVLESVRGPAPSSFIDVYLNVPAGSTPEQHPDLQAGTVATFGLNVASDPASGHGGNGMNYTIDITDLVTRLRQAGGFDPDQFHVTLALRPEIDDRPLTVDRISILKRSGVVS